VSGSSGSEQNQCVVRWGGGGRVRRGLLMGCRFKVIPGPRT
jgi:hypothetical protein